MLSLLIKATSLAKYLLGTQNSAKGTLRRFGFHHQYVSDAILLLADHSNIKILKQAVLEIIWDARGWVHGRV